MNATINALIADRDALATRVEAAEQALREIADLNEVSHGNIGTSGRTQHIARAALACPPPAKG